jgi:hypothetical protein
VHVESLIGQIIHGLRSLLEGKREEAIATIGIASSDFRDPEGLYYLARQLAYAGAAEDAIALLDRATAAGFCCYPWLTSDGWLNPLRDRPDFAAVLGRAQAEHELAAADFAAAGGDQILGVN